MISAFFLILIISTALVFGNEFSVGFFIHPSLARVDHRAFLPAIQVFARFFGKIMPIWMPVTLILHLLLLWLTWRWPAIHTMFLVCAAILWIIIIVFSLLGPVPINDRVKAGLPRHGIGPHHLDRLLQSIDVDPVNFVCGFIL